MATNILEFWFEDECIKEVYSSIVPERNDSVRIDVNGVARVINVKGIQHDYVDDKIKIYLGTY